MTRRILVTGGAGFIGSHLCERLLEQGHRVTCVDNFLTGSMGKIAHLLPHPGFRLICQDVISPLEIDVDQIYHLACPASPVHYQLDPVQTIKTCVQGSLNVLELAKGLGSRILQASTSEVYGDPLVHPQSEGYWGNVNPLGARSCYDEGKRCAESLFFNFHRQYGLPIRVVRIFNTYGPRMNPGDGRVVSSFIMQALKGEDLEVYGDGSQTRSFCYVDDLIGGLIASMEQDMGPGPLNLGNPVEISILDLASQVIRLCDSRSSIVNLRLPQDDPRRRCPDITSARALLNWEPTVALEEGLRKTIAHLREGH